MTRLAFNLDAQSKLNLANYKVSIDNFYHSDVFYKKFYGVLLSITSTLGGKTL